MDRQITAIIVGNGDRATQYCKLALEKPQIFKVVGVVEPNSFRRKEAKQLYDIKDDMLFKDIDELLPKGKIADCIINATMDKLHIKIALPLLKLGYDMLLEKPITNNKKELIKLQKAVKQYKNKVMVCHVLRYTPFYKKIKELVMAGEVGEIMHIETNENIGVIHASNSYIRGKWNNSYECGSSMLLAKCCHDLDLICWLNNNNAPLKVSSFGGRDFLIKEKAPVNAKERCLDNCQYLETCKFSAKYDYLENDNYPYYTWASLNKKYDIITKEEKFQSLLKDNPHGECAYKTKANIVDHQCLILQFSNGSTAMHSMITAQARPGRKIHIMGTDGEIEGYLDGNKFVLRKFNKANGLYTEKLFDFSVAVDENDKHFGGDQQLMLDFVKLVNGEKTSISCTTIDDSINGHLCVFYADKSMLSQKTIKF